MNGGGCIRLTSPLLWAFALGLLLRAVLPAGVMVDAQAPGGPLIMCSGHGPIAVALDSGHGKPVRHAPAERSHEGECPFAGGHAFTPPAAIVPQPAQALMWPSAPAQMPFERTPALQLRAPPPPSRAPPLVLS